MSDEKMSPEDQKKLQVLRSLAMEGFREIEEGRGILIEDEQALIRLMDEIHERVMKQSRSRSQQ